MLNTAVGCMLVRACPGLPAGIPSVRDVQERVHLASLSLPTARVPWCLLLQDALDSIVDMREHDVPYHVRFEIDCDVRCGHWFTVKAKVSVGTPWL